MGDPFSGKESSVCAAVSLKGQMLWLQSSHCLIKSLKVMKYEREKKKDGSVKAFIIFMRAAFEIFSQPESSNIVPQCLIITPISIILQACQLFAGIVFVPFDTSYDPFSYNIYNVTYLFTFQ